MKNMSVTSLFLAIANTIRRYTVTIFIVLIVVGLSASVLLLNTILQDASNTNGVTSSVDDTGFDQSTIDRVKQLHTSADVLPDLTLPSGRVNPFAE